MATQINFNFMFGFGRKRETGPILSEQSAENVEKKGIMQRIGDIGSKIKAAVLGLGVLGATSCDPYDEVVNKQPVNVAAVGTMASEEEMKEVSPTNLGAQTLNKPDHVPPTIRITEKFVEPHTPPTIRITEKFVEPHTPPTIRITEIKVPLIKIRELKDETIVAVAEIANDKTVIANEAVVADETVVTSEIIVPAEVVVNEAVVHVEDTVITNNVDLVPVNTDFGDYPVDGGTVVAKSGDSYLKIARKLAGKDSSEQVVYDIALVLMHENAGGFTRHIDIGQEIVAPTLADLTKNIGTLDKSEWNKNKIDKPEVKAENLVDEASDQKVVVNEKNEELKVEVEKIENPDLEEDDLDWESAFDEELDSEIENSFTAIKSVKDAKIDVAVNDDDDDLSWELALDEEINNEIEASFNVIESIKTVETKLDSGLDLDLIRKVGGRSKYADIGKPAQNAATLDLDAIRKTAGKSKYADINKTQQGISLLVDPDKDLQPVKNFLNS